MLRRYNRLLVVCFLVADAVSAVFALVLAYFVRFSGPFAEVVPITKTQPPFSQYLMVLPVVAVLIPLAFQVQGLYRLRRGRTRVDDFFAVLVGSLLAVLAGVVLSLYAQAYYPSFRDYHPISRGVLGAVPGAERRLHVHLARGRPGSAPAPVARRHRLASCADRRRRRSGTDGGGPNPRSQRAGLQAGRLR